MRKTFCDRCGKEIIEDVELVFSYELCYECAEAVDIFITNPSGPSAIDVPLDKVVPKEDKTFDIVDAFMHLIWGRKVRMTHWDEGEYIKLVECNLPLGREYLHEKEIVNQDGGTYPAEWLFDKSHLDAIWEDYKEENSDE